MDKIAAIEKKMELCQESFVPNVSNDICESFLSVWDDLKDLMVENSLADINELQKAYGWSDFVSNYVQDIEETLEYASRRDSKYCMPRIEYCEELLNWCNPKDTLLVENTRRSITESHFILGNVEQAERLYQKWLEDDPAWGWGYIGWSDAYHFGTEKIPVDFKRAEEIIKQGLAEPEVRDREDIMDRLFCLYETTGESKKLAAMTAATAATSPPVIGRNSPCPCLSGKKYKKCCGRDW